MMKNDHHILYSFRRCPYAVRGRLGLAVSGVEYEHREIVLRDKPQAMLDISPKGTVPVLQLADGTVLEESLDILFWALQQNDPENWLEYEEEAKVLVAENDGPFKKALDRYKYPNRYQDEAGAADMDWREEGMKFLLKLEALLEKNSYLYRQTLCVADAAVFPFVRQFANTDKEWWEAEARLAHTRAWLEKCVDSDLFNQVMEKHQPWVQGDAPIYKPVK